MDEFVFTEKQKELINLLQKNELKRINILFGSVRSGKTFISLLLFALWSLKCPKNTSFLMCAKTLKSLERNCLDPLRDMLGESYFNFNINNKKGTLFGKKVFLEGASDSSSEDKIRGITLQGAYVDEITIIDHDFFKMLLSRLSMPNAKLIGTTNPDSPSHWLKKEFIDRQNELDILVKKFVLEDNTTLTKEYINSLKSEYTGVYYDRFILGNFVRAEGLVFPSFANNTINYLIDPIKAKLEVENNNNYYIIIGVDFGGNKSKTCFVASAISKDYKRIIALNDFVVASDYGFNTEIVKDTINSDKLSFEIDTQKICSDFEKFYNSIYQNYGFVDYVFCDSASPTMINSIRAYFRDLGARYNNILPITKTPITDRPKTIDKLLNTNRLKISENCKKVIEALQELVWDEKKENVPADDNINNINDMYDAFCYSWIEFTNRIDGTTL